MRDPFRVRGRDPPDGKFAPHLCNREIGGPLPFGSCGLSRPFGVFRLQPVFSCDLHFAAILARNSLPVPTCGLGRDRSDEIAAARMRMEFSDRRANVLTCM